jgi:hypothetical protein
MAANGILLCTDDDADVIGREAPGSSFFQPPPRAVVNQVLKGGVLDRNLADAMIYAGTYGEAIERGMAAALCRAAGGAVRTPGGEGRDRQGNDACKWPAVADLKSDHYLFVTHSLGSRILFETLVDLQKNQLGTGWGRRQSARSGGATGADEGSSQDPAINGILSKTAGVYMMANQMVLFEMASIPGAAAGNSRPAGTGMGMGLTRPGGAGAGSGDAGRSGGGGRRSLLSDLTQSLEDAVSSESPPASPGNNLLPPVNSLRRDTGSGRSSLSVPIVSFNDTNDLLTWHIPEKEAQSPAGPSNGGQPADGKQQRKMQIADVYVRNDIRWLGLFEWPLTAHSGYFGNSDVWSVMFCGADGGKALPCK